MIFYSSDLLLASACFASLSLAKEVHISVSNANAAPIFDPPSSRANIGDILVFHFWPRTHSVIQATVDSPCIPADDGFYSGPIRALGPSENGTTFNVVVQNTEPIWFFCGTSGHCGEGMVGAVNTDPELGPSVDDFRTVSLGALTGAVAVPAGHGGFFGSAIQLPPDLPDLPTSLFPPPGGDSVGPSVMGSVGVSTSVTTSVIAATTTDGFGGMVTTGVGTGTYTVTRTHNGTCCSSSSRSYSLVPSWTGAAVPNVGGRGAMGLLGLVGGAMLLA